MAKVIKLRKGLDINLKGKAAKETASLLWNVLASMHSAPRISQD